MPINASEAPQAAFDAIAATIVQSANGLSSQRAGQLNPKRLFLSVPHRVASLPLSKTRRDAKLRDAVQLGAWRYLVVEEQAAPAPGANANVAATYSLIADVTTTTTDGGGGYRLGMWSEGSVATGTEAAIRAAEKLEAVQNGDYEPLLLSAPALHMTALWLKSRNHVDEDADLILPIESPNPVLVSGVPLSPKALLEKLHYAAEALPPNSATE